MSYKDTCVCYKIPQVCAIFLDHILPSGRVAQMPGAFGWLTDDKGALPPPPPPPPELIVDFWQASASVAAPGFESELPRLRALLESTQQPAATLPGSFRPYTTRRCSQYGVER